MAPPARHPTQHTCNAVAGEQVMHIAESPHLTGLAPHPCASPLARALAIVHTEVSSKRGHPVATRKYQFKGNVAAQYASKSVKSNIGVLSHNW